VNKVLFATDLSPISAAALPHAINFTAMKGGELHLLHAIVLHGTGSRLEELAEEEEEARVALDGMGPARTRVVRAVVRGVAAAPSIVEYADVQGVELIVMGSHGRRGVRRLLLGSVTEEVVRASECPVLVVPRTPDGAPARHNYARILAPIDFSIQSEAGLRVAADLARRFDAGLELIHAVDIPTLPELYGPSAGPLVDVKRATDAAMATIETLAAPLRHDVTVATSTSVGGAVHTILEAAEPDTDLIVMPTHGYSGLDRLLMGSVAEGVLRRARCPVLLIKPSVLP